MKPVIVTVGWQNEGYGTVRVLATKLCKAPLGGAVMDYTQRKGGGRYG